jgi:hypothetical protein
LASRATFPDSDATAFGAAVPAMSPAANKMMIDMIRRLGAFFMMSPRTDVNG